MFLDLLSNGYEYIFEVAKRQRSHFLSLSFFNALLFLYM